MSANSPAAGQATTFWRAGLLALVLITLVRSLIWAFANPPLDAGDETAHLMYIVQLRNTGALPVYKFTPPPSCVPSADSTPADPAAAKFISDRGYATLLPWSAVPFEGFQAPLYYLTAAVISLPVPGSDVLGILYSARILSSFLAAALVFIAACAIRQLTPNPALALGGAALISSIPTFGYYGGVATNDNMLNLFAAAIALVALRTLRTSSSALVPASLLLGALEGGAILSKASGVALIPVGILAVAFALSTRQRDNEGRVQKWWTGLLVSLRSPTFWSRFVGLAALYFAALLLVAGWWMVRNLSVYGDLLGTANHFTYAPACWWGPPISAQSISTWPGYAKSLALLTPFSFLASFGWGDENIGVTAYYLILLPLLLLGAYVSARWLVKNWKRLSLYQQMGLILLSVQGAVGLFLLLSVNFVLQYQPVGRFLYPALLPIVGFLGLGLLSAGSNRKLNWVLLGVVLIGLNALTIGGYMLSGTGWIAVHAAQRAHSFLPFLFPPAA